MSPSEKAGLIDRKGLRKAETGKNNQIGHFKVIFPVKVKVEEISLSCWLKQACWEIWLLSILRMCALSLFFSLSLALDFWEGQIRVLVSACQQGTPA